MSTAPRRFERTERVRRAWRAVRAGDVDLSVPVGSLVLGQTIPTGFNYGTETAQTADTYAQIIRTGTGDILSLIHI